ncbi:MAG TPA: carbonic anhydrase [Saprospiraceae bacterium]|nr:carbonic anhydrase [Saprospiraceae bacterium]HNT19401.1 carbonic anhydrase [Saprospiraceae bacterium]
MRTHKDILRTEMTPPQALEILKEGNLRFLNNIRINRDLLKLVDEHTESQAPFAAILGCSDSRVPVEIVFDQGLGDLFVVRLAGNIASINAIGSLEFSCKLLGSKIIVVLGHTSCGAVKAACDKTYLGNLETLVKSIEPAVHDESVAHLKRDSNDKDFLKKVTILNIRHQINTIYHESEILREMVEKGQIILVGALYDVNSGEVQFLDPMD